MRKGIIVRIIIRESRRVYRAHNGHVSDEGNVRTDNDVMYLLCAIEQQQQKNPVKHSPHNPTDSI